MDEQEFRRLADLALEDLHRRISTLGGEDFEVRL